MKDENVLEEANKLVHGARQNAYAHPLDNFGRIAKMWSAILGVEVTEEQHALCMLAVKIARLMQTPDHRDSIVDVAGYAATLEMVIEERKRRNSPIASNVISAGTISKSQIRTGLPVIGEDGKVRGITIGEDLSDRSYVGWNPNESAHP